MQQAAVNPAVLLHKREWQEAHSWQMQASQAMKMPLTCGNAKLENEVCTASGDGRTIWRVGGRRGGWVGLLLSVSSRSVMLVMASLQGVSQHSPLHWYLPAPQGPTTLIRRVTYRW
jgi:hypothetical protein